LQRRDAVARTQQLTGANSQVIPPAMGLAQVINFQPTGGGKAAITGDFVLLASEVNPAIKALRDNSIEVTGFTVTCCRTHRIFSSCTFGQMTTRRSWREA